MHNSLLDYLKERAPRLSDITDPEIQAVPRPAGVDYKEDHEVGSHDFPIGRDNKVNILSDSEVEAKQGKENWLGKRKLRWSVFPASVITA